MYWRMEAEFLILNSGSWCKMLPVTQVLLLLWPILEVQLQNNKSLMLVLSRPLMSHLNAEGFSFTAT